MTTATLATGNRTMDTAVVNGPSAASKSWSTS